jgi:UDP-N-acetylglucosamine 2-epimerase
MLEEFAAVYDRERPDCVLVYGDTNSTLTGALLAVKTPTPLVHVEAGLRSGDRSMPEEVNRILVDHAADVCCPPTAAAVQSAVARENRRLQREAAFHRPDVCLRQAVCDVQRRSRHTLDCWG